MIFSRKDADKRYKAWDLKHKKHNYQYGVGRSVWNIPSRIPKLKKYGLKKLKKEEAGFAALMKSKKKPSFYQRNIKYSAEPRGLMLSLGKKLKRQGKTKELKQFKQDMLGLTYMGYLNKHL